MENDTTEHVYRDEGYNAFVIKVILPILQKTEVDVLTRLKDVFNAYNKQILHLSVFSPGQLNYSIERIIGMENGPQKYMLAILRIFRLYLCGEYETVKFVYEHAIPSLEIFPVVNINHDYDLYRIRKSTTTEPINVNDIKNVICPLPFSKRHKTIAHRFGQSGYTALYLYHSIYTGWEQHKRPEISSLYYSEFKSKQDISLYDFRIIKEDNEVTEQFLQIAPILLACYLFAEAAQYSFKSEYIFSQLLYQAFVSEFRENKIGRVETKLGIIANSTRVPIEKMMDANLSEYIALPIFVAANEEISDPVADMHWKYIEEMFEYKPLKCLAENLFFN